jgi:hypothetical protein
MSLLKVQELSGNSGMFNTSAQRVSAAYRMVGTVSDRTTGLQVRWRFLPNTRRFLVQALPV